MLDEPLDELSFKELLQETAWMASKKPMPSTPVKISKSLPSTSTAEAEYMPKPIEDEDVNDTSNVPGPSNSNNNVTRSGGGGKFKRHMCNTFENIQSEPHITN